MSHEEDAPSFDAQVEQIVPDPAVQPEVELVVPPSAYVAIDTDTPVGEPAGSRVEDSSALMLQALAELSSGLARRLDGLTSLFEREVRAEATREKVVDRLHAELQEYKQGLLLGILRPVFVDLIQLHDDIGKILESQAAHDAQEPPPDRVGRLLDLMSGFQQGIEDILYRQGVEPFRVEGDTFDPRRQRAITTIACDDPALARRVASRLRKGFQADDRVVRPEHVAVYAPFKPS